MNKYQTKLKEQSGASLKNYDEISRLEFKDFRDSSGNLVAWMWVGLSRFEKQIPKVNHMRGLRVRSANIQLGNDDALQNLFKESRGNYYYVGEVFAAAKELIPNSQRDYFNENETRVLFEDLLREYFYDVLHKLYYEANRVKNDYKRQEEYLNKVAEYQKKEKEQGFVDETNTTKVIDPGYCWIIPTGADSKPVKIAFEGGTIVDEYVNADRSREIQVYKKVGVTAMLANNICAYADTELMGKMDLAGSVWDSSAYINEVNAYPKSYSHD